MNTHQGHLCVHDMCLPLNAVYVLRTQWYGSRPVCLVELSIKWERRAVVSHCGLASGELGKQIGWSSFASHTHSHAHILCKQSALFPSIPALCSQSVQKAAGLMKWKWLIITRAMTAAVSRHHTLAYLWHCVRGAVLYCTNTLSIYTFFYPSSTSFFLSIHVNCVVSVPRVYISSRVLFIPCFVLVRTLPTEITSCLLSKFLKNLITDDLERVL